MLMKSQNVWHLNEGFLFQVMRRILSPFGPNRKREEGKDSYRRYSEEHGKEIGSWLTSMAVGLGEIIQF